MGSELTFVIAERRVAAAASAGSIKLPSPVPVSNSGYNSSSGATQKSSLSRVHPRQSPVRQRRGPASAGMDDEDAEGEEDEEGGDAEDQGIYCYCQKLSYGEVRRTLLPDTGRALHCRPVWRAGGEGVLARTPLTEPVCSYR